jgi:hypothetical protein
MEAASTVIVDLYRLAFNAGRPVTFEELLDGMPSAYQNDANRWWVAKEEAAGRIAPPDPWPASMLRSVKAEWLREQVRTMYNTKRFTVAHRDGGPAKGKPRDELVYQAKKEKARNGQGGPPMVEEEVLVRRMVPWTPEIGATGRRHMKGVQFRDAMARIRALGQHDKDGTFVASKKELGEALELAAEALAFTPARPDADG